MAHHSTVFSQFLKLVPRHAFDRLAEGHHRGRKLRAMTRWSQFVALAMGQLSGRRSLRDIVANLAAQGARLYHLGLRRPVARSSLARVNERQPYTLYEALFQELYGRCRRLAPKHRFRFKNKLYSLDSSLIDLSLKVFPWAHYALGKAAMKLHVGLDHDGYLPAFAVVTESRTADMTVARTLRLPRRSIVVFDKGYADYGWHAALTAGGIFFVTRARANMRAETLESRPVTPNKGVIADRTIRLTGKRPQEEGMGALRRIDYVDAATGRAYVFLTNIFHLAARTIADLYKARWQVELFFKWLKQNLKIKAFLGTTRNAVLTQIWVALCVMLLLAYMKFLARIQSSAQDILRLLQVNLFARRDMMALIRGTPPRENQILQSNQLVLL